MLILTHNHKKIKLNQFKYNQFVAALDFSSLHCSACDHWGFSYHASYFRYIDFFGSKKRIKITRIICDHCGITHAVLLQDMIPYSSLSHSEIISVLLNAINDHVVSAHFYFLKFKYVDVDIFSFSTICLLNSRNYPVLLFST